MEYFIYMHTPYKNWALQSIAIEASAIYVRRTVSIYCIVINLHNRIITILLKQRIIQRLFATVISLCVRVWSVARTRTTLCVAVFFCIYIICYIRL